MISRIASTLTALTMILVVAVPAFAQSTAAPVSITTAASLGSILVDQNGMTLYTLSSDQTNLSSCTGQCATSWPPASAAAMPPGSSSTYPQLGTITRSDGSTQLTWAGRPLYRFSGDSSAGQTNGNGINAFGGTWAVVSNPTSISATTSSSSTTTSSSTPSSSSTSTSASSSGGTSGPGGLVLYVDTPTSGATVNGGQSVDIGGWTTGYEVTVTLDSTSGQLLGQAAPDDPRPDVAQSTGQPGLANSGYNVSWDVTRVTNGTHILFITSTSQSGQTVVQQVPVSVSGATSGGAPFNVTGAAYSGGNNGGFSSAYPGSGYSGSPYAGAGYPGSPYSGAGYSGSPYSGAGYPGSNYLNSTPYTGTTYPGSPYGTSYSGSGYPYNGTSGYPYTGTSGYPYTGTSGYPYTGTSGYPYSGTSGYPYTGTSGYPYTGGYP